MNSAIPFRWFLSASLLPLAVTCVVFWIGPGRVGAQSGGAMSDAPQAAAKQPIIVELSDRQLRAYNAADLDAFCACYHEEVRVLDEDGKVTIEGMEDFRKRYEGLFTGCDDVHATISQRILLGRTVCELEQYQRRPKSTGVLDRGEIIVRYTERDGKIGTVQFFRP